MSHSKHHSRSWLSVMTRALFIILGAFIYTVGLDLFLVPNNIIDGGVVGISLMAATLSGYSFSIFVVLINLPFLYLGYRVIGKTFTLSTLFGIVWMAIFSNFMHHNDRPFPRGHLWWNHLRNWGWPYYP